MVTNPITADGRRLGDVLELSQRHCDEYKANLAWRQLFMKLIYASQLLQRVREAEIYDMLVVLAESWPWEETVTSLRCTHDSNGTHRSPARPHLFVMHQRIIPPTRPSLSRAMASPAGLSHARLPVPQSLACWSLSLAPTSLSPSRTHH